MAAFHGKSIIHLRSTTIHHLLCMALWVLILISELIPKWRATLTLILESYSLSS
jgi:hypothetical protein